MTAPVVPPKRAGDPIVVPPLKVQVGLVAERVDKKALSELESDAFGTRIPCRYSFLARQA
jgi:hypothetical protein